MRMGDARYGGQIVYFYGRETVAFKYRDKRFDHKKLKDTFIRNHQRAGCHQSSCPSQTQISGYQDYPSSPPSSSC